ncbi:AraC-type DNA-binding protein [Chitinophaga terrae (ex Kim and Jung 2007)]|uniref:AraC-type DNA-binding protein n=1 Tax=Chitinophaga terrae (ex Kim and Jung 2007) TaxID=408074 RepID=A0A1H3XYY4_9BACT|nr:AraC family transcriptional regulator [Chitinophaga terrae (ex Kim and Jung 2007)]GEP89484.1 AraC family transcriptional regulator [Chitinophaga terrae (ex Kim and Jung 2007)]SEA04586.1 AraC-type DNA-binding protein [Chitinophaga terrae (ex Kim and Jung 2007)]
MSKALIPTYDICSLALGKPASEDLLVAKFEEYLEAHKDIRFPHRHSFYHLAFFTDGGGTHTIDFERFPVKKGQLYFMTPGQVHSWFFSGKITGYVMNVSAAFFNAFLKDDNYIERFPFFSGVSAEGVVQLPQEKIRGIADLFERMLEEVNRGTLYSIDMLRLLTLELFIQVSRATSQEGVKQELPHNYLLLRNFRKLVDQHYMQLKLPKEYAALLYVTPNYLNAFCRHMLGKSAGEIIRDRVLLEAKRLLTNADMSIASIAWQLNFADNSYFTKFFKKYTGITPEEFRKNLA